MNDYKNEKAGNARKISEEAKWRKRMKYVKKQAPLEAFQFKVGPMPEWANFLQFSNEIKTLDGTLFVHLGDYVVKDIYGGQLYETSP